MRQLKIRETITRRESESLEIYLNQIGHESMITPEEEVELAQRIKQGDLVARNKLTRANLRFVVSVAKQYQNQGMGLSDLINEGNLGLIKAAEKFDETKGFKFISYAVWWIRQSILQALAEQSRMVRLPLNQVNQISKINKAQAQFEQDYERKASAYEMADILDIPEDKIEEVLKSSGHTLSIDAPISDDQEDTVESKMSSADTPSTDNYLMQESLSEEINRVLSTLPEKESSILKMCFGIDSQEMSLEEIGASFNLSRERVRQIKEKAIRSLRHGSRCDILKSYLG
ncbi:MAG: sigma-70 family RNA polymerase sigma factor [Paludibacteraceae bacterium]|nr:sigma-70 family RNA polymerase sigma factor [Paludibacteraceae bacterium]